MKKLKTGVSWLLVLMWMGIIYALSAQTATVSSDLSGSVLELLVSMTGNLLTNHVQDLMYLHFLVRKYAHFSAYAILGILVMSAFLKTKARKESYGLIVVALNTFIVCFLYAYFDEWHQTFVAGRSGEFRDVLIDSAGASFGILLVMGIVLLHTAWKRQTQKKYES